MKPKKRTLININTKNGHLSYNEFIKRNFKVSLLNIQSVGKKSNLIQDFVGDSCADILFLTETWLFEKGDEVRIKNMTPLRYSCKSHPRRTGLGGGICIFYKNIYSSHINFKQILTYNTFECSEIVITLDGSSISFYCIYRPPPSIENKFTPAGFLLDFEKFLMSTLL